MKKVLFGLLAGFAMTTNVMAADAGSAIATGVAITTVAGTGCSLLSEGVTINLSNGVFGAYACNTVDNVIAVATCHPTGRKGDVTVDCDPTAADGDANFVEGCAATAGQAATVGTAIVQGGLAYIGSSQGGRVGGTNAANCIANGNTITEAQGAAGL